MVENSRHSKTPKRTGPHKRITCPHCGTEGAVTTHALWHMDKCKHKP
jgi:transcription elongation factor Elf1